MSKRPDRLRSVPVDGLPEWTVAIAVPTSPSPAAAALLAQLSGALTAPNAARG